MTSETKARLIIGLSLVVVVGMISAAVFFHYSVIDLHARIPEEGGWSIEQIQAETGKPVKLRITADDVVHGFAVGKYSLESIDLEPGKPVQVSLTFDEPGSYTYYCSRWCGLNHWRMRGVIEVSGGKSPIETHEKTVPLYVDLGIDIDEPHPARNFPLKLPSSKNGKKLVDINPVLTLEFELYINDLFYRTHSPSEVFSEIRKNKAFQGLNTEQIWDLVAYIWEINTSQQGLAEGYKIYADNCAVCHGEQGKGDGVYADEVSDLFGDSMKSMQQGEVSPVDFSDSSALLGASPALLEGKIIRGGMGTGMPYWGSLFTDGQIRDLVAFIYSHSFLYNETRSK